MADAEAKLTERELREQLEHAEAIAHMGSWRWEIASGTVTWSDELYRIYGQPQTRPITLELFLSFLHPDERHRVQREIEAALQQRGRFAYRELIVRPDGELRTLDTVGEAVTDEGGNVTALIGTCRDVTDEARRDARLRFYGDVFERVQVGLSAWQIDRREDPPRLRLVAFNAATEAIVGGPLAGLLGQPMTSILPQLSARELPAIVARLAAGGGTEKLAPIGFGESPGARFVTATLFPLLPRHIGLVLEDVTAQRCAQILQAGERRALQMLAEGAPLPAILEVIACAIEEASPLGTLASILLVDETDARMRHGAAPHLPEAYTRAIDGSPVGERVGSCGTAAYRREPVYTTDIATDPLWDDYRELAERHGLGSCWSVPILSEEGRRVLGTFAMYHREPREPDEAARELLKRASHVTGIVLERRTLDEQLRALAARTEAIREDERTAIARDIHDQLGQALTALKLDLGWLGRRIEGGELSAKVEEMARATDEILRTVRRISADLRPGILDTIGLQAAIEWQAEEFEQRSGMRCRVRAEIGDLHLDRELATTVFRIFQESLTNVARHADARQVDVTLVLDHGQLRLEVADDGVGIPEVGPRRSTLGILGMGERARRLGGSCTVKRRAPRGTVVLLVMPLRFPSERRGTGA
ncbi:MAG TPA: GAF domain-containing protein [Kofleriaceae bacterium]|nr:GAF domain-containing protein [Kofleriaceae bacterium]